MFWIKSLFALLLVVVLGWVGYAMTSSPIVPQTWNPPANPGLTGPFAANDLLASVDTLPMPGIGPEDVACAADGSYYTGLVDGRIMRWRQGQAPELFADTGGRPLGMVFDANNQLVVADADRGLLSVDPSGQVTVLADTYRDRPMLFVDDLDIAEDGTIWFSDASMRFGFRQNLLDFFEGSMTGRLLSYQPSTGEVRTHIDGLFFANGVALGPDDSFVLINETGLGRVHRLWLKGERAGQSDVFIDNLPGTPDNINFDGTDTFWIAMPSLRDGIDDLADKPFLRRMISVLPEAALGAAANITSFVLGVNLEGEVVENYQDPALGYNYITSATACGDTLWLGSLHMPAVASMPLAN